VTDRDVSLRAAANLDPRQASNHPHLLAPGQIGPLALRNRIVLAPMGDRLANDDGTVSERQTAYLEARARGGAALILVGSASVAYPEGSYAPCQTAISDDRFVAGLAHLADRVHLHDAKIAAQLVHDGANSLLDIAEGRPMLVPSIPPRLRPDALSAMVTEAELAAMTRPFMSARAALDYRVATEDDLAWVVERFADAATRAEAAGFDGVEIHAGHGYLLDSFLSPALNQRDDDWGGSVTNRSRLLVGVIRAVRERVGGRMGVWCRLNALERFRDGGETPDDLVEVAALAVAAGVDAVSVSAATDAGAALGVTEAHTPHAPGLLVPFAARVRAAVSVPVVTVGRIEPDAAEQILADGQADFIAMGRKLLAEPDLPNKLAAGDVERIRPCIYQYRCIGNIFLNEPVGCVANAATAHGDADLPPATTPRRYLVVGGGPAGCEAARLLAARGHDVVLADAAPELGGTLIAAGHTDEVLAQFVSWLRAEIERSPVELRLSTRVTPELVDELDVDDVVVAVGGNAYLAPGIRVGEARVLGAGQIAAWLDAHGAAGPHDVVVLGGDKTGLSIAQACARRGHAVTVLEPGYVFAARLGPPGRFRMVHETEQLGVRLEPSATTLELAKDAVVWRSVDGTEHRTGAHTVFLASIEPRPSASDELASAGRPVHVIGDARADGGVEGAMADALALAAAAD
jgi:2,4-dienoyl-CoA reductase-like NADH-dependent reductase (Old Yellow Enzyme family)/thioredoxin reductase